MTCWRQFLRTFLIWAIALAGVCYGFVLLVDPYDTLPISLDFEREPISTNQRFSFPALAAKPRFDSAIIGTSTTRLLQPSQLNGLFDGAFVNLSMNSATTYEQFRIFKLFVRHHPAPKHVIFGIDREWCSTKVMPKFTFRPFPPWLYDENRWNDLLYLFNFKAVEQAGRQFARLIGLREPKYGLDGYTNFLPPKAEYDIEKARSNLYGPQGPRSHQAIAPPQDNYAAARRALVFPQHARMQAMLASLPDTTTKVLLFIPYHHINQPQPGSLADAVWQECKTRLTAMLPAGGNNHALDFMIPSAITERDENYWDPLHFSVEIADRLATMIKAGVTERRGWENYFRYLR